MERDKILKKIVFFILPLILYNCSGSNNNSIEWFNRYEREINEFTNFFLSQKDFKFINRQDFLSSYNNKTLSEYPICYYMGTLSFKDNKICVDNKYVDKESSFWNTGLNNKKDYLERPFLEFLNQNNIDSTVFIKIKDFLLRWNLSSVNRDGQNMTLETKGGSRFVYFGDGRDIIISDGRNHRLNKFWYYYNK